MAVDTSPTLTSTSHTLSGQPVMAPAAKSKTETASADTDRFFAGLRLENRHKFLEPSADTTAVSLQIVKDTLEAVASQVSDLQLRRLKESRKRKRSERNGEAVLKLRKVYIEGFQTGQVWQQAKRIIDGVLRFTDGLVDELGEQGRIVESDGSDGSAPGSLTFGEDGFEVGSDDSGDEEEEGEDQYEDEDEDEEEGESQDSGAEAEQEVDHGDEDVDSDQGDDLNNEQSLSDEEDEDQDGGGDFVQDPNGLNDGFFSIDAFNKQTQLWEDQDARGDAAGGEASDEEDVDWAADPLAPSHPTKSKPRHDAGAATDDEDEDEEDGPTFGNMSLDAPEGASDDEDMDLADDDGADMNANEVYYKDFFAPPSRKNKTGNQRPKKAVHFEDAQEAAQEDVERAMENVKRDLFGDDDSDAEDSDNALSDVSAGDPKSRRSTHERRQAKLASEIRKLEAASVAKREWALSGEAAAADRPLNSLLEEDVDFEHVGKPVPVVTPQVSEDMEQLIKRRILAQEFDEVLRRRPDTDSTPTTRRGLVDVDDSKPKGLAAIYEEEHIKAANPDTYVSQSDEKLRKEEHQVEALWKDVAARLDALSSWHYKPRPAVPTLTVVSDLPTISMEDAQPTTAQGVAGATSRLAPQETYKGEAAAGEVVTKSGAPLARAEMSREDKTRRRRRHKERLRKAGGPDAQSTKTMGTRAQMQRDTVAELRKGGVKVINRKGEITDVDGNKPRAAKALSSSSFKL